LTLPASERADVAAELLASLEDEETDPADIEAAWVIYLETETAIRVLAVAHDKRRPRYWRTRL